MLDTNKIPKFNFTLSCECGNSIQIGGGIPLLDKAVETGFYTEEDIYNCKKIAGFVDWDKFDITVDKHICILKCKKCGREISIMGL